jgi:hypothetical protein
MDGRGVVSQINSKDIITPKIMCDRFVYVASGKFDVLDIARDAVNSMAFLFSELHRKRL